MKDRIERYQRSWFDPHISAARASREDIENLHYRHIIPSSFLAIVLPWRCPPLEKEATTPRVP